MATTPKPTILKTPGAKASGTSAGTEAASSTPAKTSGGKSGGMLRGLLIGGGAVLLLVGLAAGGWMWKRHGRVHDKTAATASTKVAPEKASLSATTPATVEMPLEPFVVNLADAGGHSYARVGLTLRLIAPAGDKKADAKGAEDKKAGAGGGDDLRDVARDTIIDVLSQQQSADLLAVGGKDHLKQLLRQAMLARDPRLQVTDIYFTEFLVQP